MLLASGQLDALGDLARSGRACAWPWTISG